MSSEPTPPAGEPISPHVAERFALLAQEAQRETALRQRRFRRWAVYVPLSLLIAGCLWTAIAFLRVMR